MRPIPTPPVFTVAELEAAGWTRSALDNALRHGRLLRVRRGVYTSRDSITPETAAIAAARAFPQGVVSHRCATLLHGLPLLGGHPRVPDLTVPPRSGVNLPSVHVYRATLRPQDIVRVADTAVTSVARSLVDLGRHRPTGTAVAAIDAALHRHLVAVEEIEDVLRFCWNWPRIRQAQRALRLSDGRAESPLESISRLVLRWLKLPDPEPQKVIFDQYGRIVGRCDFYWDEFGVAGEADGRSKYTERPVLINEKDRQELLEDLGLIVVRWGWDYPTRRRDALRSRVEKAFARGQARDRSGFPRLWTL
jgi:hypothetical protein